MKLSWPLSAGLACGEVGSAGPGEPLVGGSGALFVAVKIGLTGGGVVLLTLLSRVKAFGRLPVALLLYGVLLGYGVLIAYELYLLGRV